MNTFLPMMFVCIAIFAFFVAALGIRMFFDSKAEFRGGCASNNPMLRNEIGECTVCGSIPEGDCEVAASEDLPRIG